MICPTFFTFADGIKRMFSNILFSDAGTPDRVKEEATYMMFLDLLYEAECM